LEGTHFVLSSLFAKPVENKAVAELFKKQLQWMLFSRVVILTLLLGTNLLLQSVEKHIIIPPFPYIAAFIISLYLYTICAALLLNFIKRYSTFAYGQFLIDVLLISLLIYYSGGSQSIFTILYFFPIIAASIILFRRGSLALAAASTLAYGIILALEYYGTYPAFFKEFWYRPLRDIRSGMNIFSIHGLTFFITAILGSLVSGRIRRTEKALITTTLKYDQLSVLYKKIFDDIPSGIITVLNQKNIISSNPAAERITDFKSEEIIGRDITTLFPNLKLDFDMPPRSEVELTRKDGRNIPIGYSFAKLNMPGTEDKYDVITLQDLSEIKHMEKQILQAQKMATIGEMAAGIAHEIRNPLAAISGAAELLDASGDINSHNQDLMNIITRECGRLQSSITEFLYFSKPVQPEKEWVPLLPLVNDAIQILQHTQDWPERCEPVIDIPDKMDCWADPQQIRKILINIMHNSCIALKNMEGKIRITAREVMDESGAEKTILTIIDSGKGIPDTAIDKIFEPFFTTRENGTGLGLSIVRQLIDAHEGGITIKSNEHSGTTTGIWLPLP
jgi:two-component system sensor histidine kinase PilS (NtrC family)